MLSMFSSAESFSIFAMMSTGLRQERAQLGDIRGSTDEAQCDVVESLLDSERRIDTVLVRDRRRRDVDAGKVDAFVALHLTAVYHACGDAGRLDVQNDELDQTIVDEDAVTDVYVVGERHVRDRHLAGPGVMLRTEDDVRPRFE